MAERYQVRGRRIWDSHWDMYTALFDTEELAEQMIRRADSYQFKPLAEWKDENPASDPVDKPRYEVRGRRIWDSETDTYSGLFGIVDNAEWVIKHRDVSKFTFKPLAEWQDEKPEGDSVEEPRYKAVGRRILDTKTDTWSKNWKDDDSAIFIAKWCNAGNAGDVHFLSISEWDEVEKRVSNAVDHPSHYTQGPIECIDAIASALGHDAFIQFLRGQVIKYMWRLGHKGDARQDAEKGKWYASRLVAELSK